MSRSLPRLALMISATCALALFLWYSSSLMHSALVPYIITVNFAIMGWAWFVFDICKPSLNWGWFDSFEIEKDGRIYIWTGLSWFRSFQQFVGWNKLLGVPQLRVDVGSIKQMEYGTRFGEVTHWACLMVVLPISFWSIISLAGTGLIYWIIGAIVFHAYPIMLQRHHRPRFRYLLERLEMRDTRQPSDV